MKLIDCWAFPQHLLRVSPYKEEGGATWLCALSNDGTELMRQSCGTYDAGFLTETPEILIKHLLICNFYFRDKQLSQGIIASRLKMYSGMQFNDHPGAPFPYYSAQFFYDPKLLKFYYYAPRGGRIYTKYPFPKILELLKIQESQAPLDDNREFWQY